MRIYLDVNALHALQATFSATEFDQRARVRDITIAIGPNVIYELGRDFVCGSASDQVRDACRFLSETQQVEYLPTLEEFIAAEFDQAISGVPIVVVLDRLRQVAARFELARLARGHAEQAATFISRRDARIRVVTPQISQLNRTRLKAFRRVRTYQEFRRRLWPTAVRQLMDLARFHRIRTTEATARRVLTHTEEFPVLNAWINAQWYCAWVATHHRTTTGNMDDLRHLLECARCDRFVTEDTWLQGTAPVISPSVP